MNDNKSVIKARKILNAIQIVAATIFWIALGICSALWVLKLQLPASQLIAVVVVLVGIGIAFFRVLSIAYDPILALLSDSAEVADKMDNLEAVVTGKPRPKRDDEKFITAKPVRNELEEASGKTESKGFFAKLFGEKKEEPAKASAKPATAEKAEKKAEPKTEKKPAAKAEKTVKAEKPAAKAKTEKSAKAEPAAKATEKKPAAKKAPAEKKPATEKKAATEKKTAASKKPAAKSTKK